MGGKDYAYVEYTVAMEQMKIAARAIVIVNDKILVMFRNKYGSQYYTLVGGRAEDGESPEVALKREVKEETGLDVISSRLVYTEEHKGHYSDQYIFLCSVAPFDEIKVQDSSEEGLLNSLQANIHRPEWSDVRSFSKLTFRTIQLQAAITEALKNDFPSTPVKL